MVQGTGPSVAQMTGFEMVIHSGRKLAGQRAPLTQDAPPGRLYEYGHGRFLMSAYKSAITNQQSSITNY
jgi:hypothetical protein